MVTLLYLHQELKIRFQLPMEDLLAAIGSGKCRGVLKSLKTDNLAIREGPEMCCITAEFPTVAPGGEFGVNQGYHLIAMSDEFSGLEDAEVQRFSEDAEPGLHRLLSPTRTCGRYV